ncbi:MAG: hypothetical protein QN717_10945 [Nitrososphaeraceae archaeon]|nr:hypothetical protein [Nitrososphaeraceae archaeon]
MLLTGTLSPYPTVVTVATHHHNASRSVFIFELGTCDFTPYMTKVPSNMTRPDAMNK